MNISPIILIISLVLSTCAGAQELVWETDDEFEQVAAGRLNFSSLPRPRNYQEALESHPQRAAMVWRRYLQVGEYKLPASDDKSLRFGATALAAALAGDRSALDKIASELATTSWIPPLTGTKIRIPVIGCQRDGDYDFLLQYLVALTLLDQRAGNTLLTEAARLALDKKFLYEVGGRPKSQRFYLPHCGWFKETENHILMIEAARYLTNQWKLSRHGGKESFYNNRLNGLEDWLAQHLAQFMRRDFDEYNSKPYETYAIIPFQLLATFAESERIKNIASAVLDHLSAKYVVFSIGGQRYVPFRRQDRFRNSTDLFLTDPQVARHAALVGHYPFLAHAQGLKWESEGRHMDALWGSLPDYFPPKLIVEALLNESELEGLQKISHFNTEIAFKSRSFLLSGGGYFKSWWGWFTDQNHGWARSATLIPANGVFDATGLVRFDGHSHEKKRANLCVHENFMCGLNPVIPKGLDLLDDKQMGQWRFLSYRAGPHVAIWQNESTRGENFGLLGAREAGEITFDDFVNQVLENNPHPFQRKGSNQYLTTKGRQLTFVFSPKKLHAYNIQKVDDTPVARDSRHWPLAQGHFYDQLIPGLAVFKDKSGSRYVIDLRDNRNPQRSTED
jgi:hypothetical protein